MSSTTALANSSGRIVLLAFALVAVCPGTEAWAASVNCTLNFNSTPQTAQLPVGTPSPQRIQVGTLSYNCSARTNFILVVTSGNCQSSPVGSKLVDPVSLDNLDYTVEFNNPTTGGSASVVTGLLATSCSNAIGRQVKNALIQNQLSSVYVNFTGSSDLAAGTYTDTLNVSLTLN